jgi:hypothetical protein
MECEGVNMPKKKSPPRRPPLARAVARSVTRRLDLLVLDGGVPEVKAPGAGIADVGSFATD